ncbi:GIY-YIG nuclease family protein, partial [Candidatus Gracilibacteria bacterium]|nr:GIY-YIG nuclease family protein [Candidatus Gracilibacteria bacterium]
MKENLEKILKNLPNSPGIYQFFDKNEEIIYVGKSVNLKSRVNSYFNGKAKLNFAKQKMVGKIEDIKIIIVNNETESLILETNLIKKLKPKYNILMKDDKNHIYIKITNEQFPKIIKTRIGPNSKKNNGTFFGPYLSSAYVENILKILKKIFGYGVGENHFFVTKNSYNLDKYLFKGNEIKSNFKQEYDKKIEQIKAFLKQDFKKIIPEFEEQMKNFAKNLEFERAQKLKQDIESMKSLEVEQLARENIIGDYDILNFLEKYEKFFIGIIKIRDSKIIGMQNFEIENNLEESSDEIINFFIEKNLLSEYLENQEKFPILILPEKIKSDSIESFFKIE